MILSLIILYVLTLIYLSIADRFRNHTSILAIQGLLLFGIAMARLHEFHTVELTFIIVETLIFKAIVIPAILMRVIHKTKINRIHSAASQFGALVMSIVALVASCTITYYMADNRTDMIFFGVALYALLTGLILIVMRKRIFAHLVGFLVIENGVFLFSMAIGVEFPILINLAIMLDILISILILGMFLRRMDNDIHTDETDALTSIKD
jgi:hydrogenase-4 component E